MEKSLVILLIVEFVLAAALGQAGTIHRREFDRAWWEWRQRATTETREAFERQRRINEVWRFGFSGMAFIVLAGATVFVYWLRRSEPEVSLRV